MTLKLGTRGSALARGQSTAIAEALSAVARTKGLDIDFELHIVTTSGDTSKDSLVGSSSTGVFVTAVREALLAGECDVVVHSLKDIPVGPYEGVTLAATPLREDSRDALCSGGVAFADLPQGARIGTGSPRRAAQMLTLRPDLEVVPVRGNVDTRLAMVGTSLDAVVLAVSGLKRLGRASDVSEIFAYDAMVPAAGQGALAVEIRTDAGADLAAAVALLDDPTTRAATTAEREALGVLEAGCSAPVGAHAAIDKGILTLTVRVTNAAGTLRLTETNRGPLSDARRIGMVTAHSLLGRGAAHLMGRP
ncbi:hydroxymethylbilane synthase [Demequina lutea]|uniref:Hydroxymethylbilane synthase n=1 Tax=Demequina lutea TaxID=431489 RepID=A0A7Z0CJL6_9MICO|nr:hydroxymethylbilane synthase [Demequina lutea]NYI41023.1 hydroxymethylbilane synthase [Demequina lutea]